MRVAVLGCGPAGLLAAHAAERLGHRVEIFSKKEKSHIHGAQYVHEPIAGLAEEKPEYISYSKVGTAAGYAKKVYGDEHADTSWDAFGDGDYAWPMTEIYDQLWHGYEHWIHDMTVTARDAHDLCYEFDLVLCSIPRPILCNGTANSVHDFRSVGVVFRPVYFGHGDNEVLYSGREEDNWYRTSKLFGHPWTEYPAETYKGGTLGGESIVGIKPTTTNCDCLSHPNLVRIGRFGKWEKKVLVTDAYRDAVKAIKSWDTGMFESRV